MVKKPRLGEMLIEEGVLTPEQLKTALKAQMIYGGRLGTNLLEFGYISEQALTSALSNQLGISAISSAALAEVPKYAINKLDRAQAEKYQVVPIDYSKDKRRLDIVLVDPTNLSVLDELSFQIGLNIRPHLASEAAVIYALERYYGITPDRRYILILEAGSTNVTHGVSPDDIGAAGDMSHLPTGDTGVAPPIPSSSPPRPSGSTETGRAQGRTSPSAREEADLGIPDSIWGEDQLDLPGCIRRLQGASNHTKAVEVLLDYGQRHFARRFVLAERAQRYEVVFSGGVEDAVGLHGRSIPLEDGSVLANVRESLRPHFGFLSQSPQNISFMKRLNEDPGGPVVVLPLASQGRADLVLVGTGIGGPLTKLEIRRLQMLTEKVSLARDILVLRRRLILLPNDLVER